MWLFCAGFQEIREKLVTLLAEEIVRLNKSGKAGKGSDYVIAIVTHSNVYYLC